jgi:hypothetical protein
LKKKLTAVDKSGKKIWMYNKDDEAKKNMKKNRKKPKFVMNRGRGGLARQILVGFFFSKGPKIFFCQKINADHLVIWPVHPGLQYGATLFKKMLD